MTELPFERAAMRGEYAQKSLMGTDLLCFYALSHIYEQYKSGNITREQGSLLKRNVFEAYEQANRFSIKYEGMWKRIEASARNYSKEPSIEHAEKFFAAVYGLPEDWRVKRS